MNKFKKELLARHRCWNFQRRPTFEVKKTHYSGLYRYEGEVGYYCYPKCVRFSFHNQINKGLEGVALCLGCKSKARAFRVIEKYAQEYDFADAYEQDWEDDRWGYDSLAFVLHAIDDAIESRFCKEEARRLGITVPRDNTQARVALGRAEYAEERRMIEAVELAADLDRTHNSNETARRQLCALGIVA